MKNFDFDCKMDELMKKLFIRLFGEIAEEYEEADEEDYSDEACDGYIVSSKVAILIATVVVAGKMLYNYITFNNLIISDLDVSLLMMYIVLVIVFSSIIILENSKK